MPSAPGYCLMQLDNMLNKIDSLILRIQQLQNERKAIYIVRKGKSTTVSKPVEFWFLAPDTVSVVYNTDTQRNVEVTITGAGIHGEYMGEQYRHPIWAGEFWVNEGDYQHAASEWASAYFLEIGTHTINMSGGPGHPLVATNIVGMSTTKFEDDAYEMLERDADPTDKDILTGSVRAAGSRGLNSIVDYIEES